MNVLVSGASGIVGYGILRSLKKSTNDINLISCSIYENSVAQGFSDIFEKAVRTDDDKYTTWLIQIIEKHKIDFIIPSIEADLYSWTKNREPIEKTGARILLNNIELINLCQDKWGFYQSLRDSNLPFAIETLLDCNFDTLVEKFGLPFLLKPRRGFASQGIVKVDSYETFNKHQEFIGEKLLVQPIIGDDSQEFTTAAFGDGKGGCFCHITLRRTLSSEGYTETAEVIDNSTISEAVQRLCQYYKPIGPTNFQFRLHNDEVKLLEINPRISSSTSIRTAFGYNESLMSVEYFMNKKEIKQPVIKQGKAVRYIEDFIYEDRTNI